MNNIVDTVEDRIENATLTAIDSIVAPKIEIAIRSMNASSRRDATSVSANPERREHVGNNTFFENASGNNNTSGVSNVNHETRHNIPDEVSELSVPETHFDRQAHTHHRALWKLNAFHLKSQVRVQSGTVPQTSWNYDRYNQEYNKDRSQNDPNPELSTSSKGPLTP